jgi:hypothetical protein
LCNDREVEAFGDVLVLATENSDLDDALQKICLINTLAEPDG